MPAAKRFQAAPADKIPAKKFKKNKTGSVASSKASSTAGSEASDSPKKSVSFANDKDSSKQKDVDKPKCERTQMFFAEKLTAATTKLFLDGTSCLQCQKDISEHQMGDRADEPMAQQGPSKGSSDVPHGLSHLRAYVWAKPVEIRFDNPVTRTLHEGLVAKAEKGYYEDVLLARKTMSAIAAVIAGSVTLTLANPLTASAVKVSASAELARVLPHEEIVDYLSELGCLLLRKYGRHLKAMAQGRARTHKEWMVAAPAPTTAKEAIVEDVVRVEALFLPGTSPTAPRAPTSFRAPAFWGGVWLRLEPAARVDIFHRIVDEIFTAATTAATKPGQTRFVTREEWISTYKTDSTSAAPDGATTPTAGPGRRRGRGRGAGQISPGHGAGRGDGQWWWVGPQNFLQTG